MNKKISHSTYLGKKVLPIMMFVFIAITAIYMFYTDQMTIGTFLFFVVFSVLCEFIRRINKKKIMDEVYDCGDYLKVRNNNVEITIDFNDIVHVMHNSNGPVTNTTLYLRSETKLTRKTLVFLTTHSQSADIKELIKRIDHVKFHGLL